MKVNRSLSNAVGLYQKLFPTWLSEGDFAVDCTMGQGYDTLLLKQCVGRTGEVYAFDIQKEALEATRTLLKAHQCFDQHVKLIHDSHEYLKTYINRPVNLFVFNLGYLPGHSKDVTTYWEKTQVAIQDALELLSKEGVLAITTYPGHPEGFIEDLELQKMISELPQKYYDVSHFYFMNQKNNPPKQYFVYKK